jgi:branched-subunit amino acid transport protein
MMSSSPERWTNTLARAAMTLLVAAIVAYAAWWLLRQLIVPIIVGLALVGIYRIALGVFRRGGW